MDENSERWRPRRLSDVAGQPEAVSTLRRFLKQGERRNLVLAGPSGSGKTTLALIYAAALCCENSVDLGDACGACPTCLDFHLGIMPAFERIGGQSLDVKRAREIVEEAQRYTSLHAPVHVYFVDEARAIEPEAAELLLPEMEQPRRPVVFIFALQNERDLMLALRRRCVTLRLGRPSPADARNYLIRHAAAESLELEPGVVDLLVIAAHDYRGLAGALQDVAQDGAVRLKAVRERFFRPEFAQALAFIDAAARQDRKEALALSGDALLAVDDWIDAIPVVLRLMEREALGLEPVQGEEGIAYTLLPPGPRTAALSSLASRAALFGEAQDRFWDRITLFWSSVIPVQTTEPALILRRFISLLHEQAPPPTIWSREALSRSNARLPIGRSRVAAGHAAPLGLGYEGLSRIYEAATLVVQEYQAPFNLRLTTFAPTNTSLDVCRELGELCHRFDARLRRWSDATYRFHYLMRHWRDGAGALQSVVIGHVPAAFEIRARSWLEAELQSRFPSNVRCAAELFQAQGFAAVRRHWRLVRLLWRDLSPHLRSTDGRPLRNLLRVDASIDFREKEALIATGRISSSQSLSREGRESAARHRLQLLSALADEAWERIFSGWEWAEAQDRAIERAERERAVANLEALYPLSGGVDEDLFKVAFAALESEWPGDAKARIRRWRGWWEPESEEKK